MGKSPFSYGAMLSGYLGQRLPDFNPNYVWELQWLFEDEDCPPHIELHPRPQAAIDQMVKLWNSGRIVVHISVSRRNA